MSWVCNFVNSSGMVAHGKDWVEYEVRMHMHAWNYYESPWNCIS